jgi:cell shape-determining protein MreC
MQFEFSHRSSSAAKANRRRLLAATALVVVLIGFDFVTAGAVRGLVRSVGSAIWQSSERVRASITETGYFSTHRALARENATLRAQVAQYQEKAAGYDVLESENAQLRAALNFSMGENTITAPVVSSFRSSPYGTFLIGAGEGDLIRVGNAVLSGGGFVLGTVSDVQTKTAAIKSALSAGERVDALIGDTPVAVIGDGGGNGHASVPLGIEIAEGTPVISPAHGGRAIGIVGKIDAQPASPDQTVYVHLPFNLASMRYVYVVRD